MKVIIFNLRNVTSSVLGSKCSIVLDFQGDVVRSRDGKDMAVNKIEKTFLLFSIPGHENTSAYVKERNTKVLWSRHTRAR